VSFLDALLLLVASVPLMGRSFKKITVMFLVLGVGLMFYAGQPLSAWIAAVLSMKNVISIIVVMQLFSIPIEVGKYNMAVRYWLQKSVKSQSILFLFTTVVTHLFSSFLLFGTVPVMVSLLGDTLKRSVSHYERFLSAAVLRGYSLALLWAPGAIILLLVVQATRVAWIEVLIPGLLLSLIGMITSVILESRLRLSADLKVGREAVDASPLTEAAARRKAYQVIIVVLGLVLLTVILEKAHFGLYSSRVLFAGAIIVLIWTSAFVRRPEFYPTLKNYWQQELLKPIDLVPLFLSLGIFSMAIEKAGLIAVVQPGLQAIVNTMGEFSMAALPAFMILCALAGVHPYVSIIMIEKVLSALQLPIEPVSLALSLSVGSVICFILSPFAGMVLTLAKFIDSRTVDIAFRWNWAFSLIFFVEGVLFAYCWGRIFL
jgi:hypothetical protein